MMKRAVGLLAFLSLNGALVAAQVPVLTLLLNGETIPEHEALDKEDVGLTSDIAGALSVVSPSTTGNLRFHQPDDYELPIVATDFYWRTTVASLGNSSRIIRLARREEAPEQSARTEGVWRCSVPTDNSRGRRDIFFGLYSRGLPSNGVLTISQGLTVMAVSPLLTEPPTITLTAVTTGGPPGSVEWTVGSTVITGNTVTLNTRSSATYTHTVTVTGRHSDPIVFTASNRRTSPAPSRQLSVSFPSPPTNVQASQVGEREVQVTWTLPTGTITGLRLSVTGQQTPINLSTSSTSHSLTDVATGTLEISVVSLSSLSGYSLYSTPGMATVEVLVFPTPVISSSSALSSTSLRVEWTLSSGSGNKAADEIIITYTRTSCPPEITGSVTIDDGSLRTRDIDGLEEFSTYTVTVTAVYRFDGSNQPAMKESAEMEVQTLSAAPSSAPPGLSVPNVMATSVELSWNELACLDQNGVITGYIIQYVGDSQAITDSFSASRTYTVEGLIPFTDYSFSVAAVNSNGTGPFSEQPVNIKTAESIPGEIDSLTVASKFKSIVLSWSTPLRLNGIITRYQVTYSVNGMATEEFNTMDNTTLNYTISSLEPGTNVTVTVRAFTSIGPGEPITINSSTLTAPPQVTNVQVSNIDGTSVRVTWDPLDILEITGYRVYYSLSGSRKRQSDGVIEVEGRETNTTTVRCLTNGATYTFTVVGVARLDGEDPIVGEVVPGQTFQVSTSSAGTTAPTVDDNNILTSRCHHAYYVEVAIGSVFATLLVYTVILVIVLLVCFYWRKKKSTPVTVYVKSKQQQKEQPDEEGCVYDVIEPTNKAIPLTQCAAYAEGKAQIRQRNAGNEQDYYT